MLKSTGGKSVCEKDRSVCEKDCSVCQIPCRVCREPAPRKRRYVHLRPLRSTPCGMAYMFSSVPGMYFSGRLGASFDTFPLNFTFRITAIPSGSFFRAERTDFPEFSPRPSGKTEATYYEMQPEVLPKPRRPTGFRKFLSFRGQPPLAVSCHSIVMSPTASDLLRFHPSNPCNSWASFPGDALFFRNSALTASQRYDTMAPWTKRI